MCNNQGIAKTRHSARTFLGFGKYSTFYSGDSAPILLENGGWRVVPPRKYLFCCEIDTGYFLDIRYPQTASQAQAIRELLPFSYLMRLVCSNDYIVAEHASIRTRGVTDMVLLYGPWTGYGVHIRRGVRNSIWVVHVAWSNSHNNRDMSGRHICREHSRLRTGV